VKGEPTSLQPTYMYQDSTEHLTLPTESAVTELPNQPQPPFGSVSPRPDQPLTPTTWPAAVPHLATRALYSVDAPFPSFNTSAGSAYEGVSEAGSSSTSQQADSPFFPPTGSLTGVSYQNILAPWRFTDLGQGAMNIQQTLCLPLIAHDYSDSHTPATQAPHQAVCETSASPSVPEDLCPPPPALPTTIRPSAIDATAARSSESSSSDTTPKPTRRKRAAARRSAPLAPRSEGVGKIRQHRQVSTHGYHPEG
jgi:hypothetical protein